MDVTVHRHARPCEGNNGRYQHGPPVEVHLCSAHDADTRPARMISLHELAHAWAETYLTPAKREQFLELRGLDRVGRSRPTCLRVGSRARRGGRVVGPDGRPVELIRIDDTDPTDLEPAFELLVGRAPLWADPAQSLSS